MTNTEPTGTADATCPHCGQSLVTGTTDFAETPDESADADLPRAELLPGQMVQSTVCTTPGCPGPDDGASI